MIRHVVSFRWKDGTSEQAIRALEAALPTLPAQIPQIRKYAYGRDIGVSPGNASFAVTADFDSSAAYPAYRDHPAHQSFVKEKALPHLAERAAVQFEHSVS